MFSYGFAKSILYTEIIIVPCKLIKIYTFYIKLVIVKLPPTIPDLQLIKNNFSNFNHLSTLESILQ